jgi:hypothetical protein
MNRVTRLALCSLLLAILTGCSYGRDPWRLQRTADGWIPQEPPTSPFSLEHPTTKLASQTWEHFETFDVGIVEFKDEGSLWSTEQRRMVVDRIRDLAKEGATIIVYAHGWHHNASVNDDNLVSFRHVLATIAAQRHVGMTCGAPTNSKNHVVGVYVGWRGESSTNKIMTWLTIWDRKRTAHHIGGPSTRLERRNPKGGLPDLLRDLDEIQTTANKGIRTADRRFTSLTIVGHSLGGAMLLSAMQQIVFNNEHPHYPTPARPLLKGVGNLVILLNPAVEARRYGYFEEAVARGAMFDPAQAPVLLTVSSKGDWPNKWPFWIARFITTLHSPNRWYEPARSLVNLGFRKTWRTHSLDIPLDIAKALDKEDPLVFGEEDYYQENVTPSSPELHLAGDAKFWRSKLRLTKRADSGLASDAPFLIVQATEALIPGHNAIFSNRLLAFLLPFATATERKRVNEFCSAMHINPVAAAKTAVK